MHLNIFNVHTKTLGLHIGDVTMRAVEFSKSKGTVKLLAASELPIPKGIIAPESIVDTGKLAESMQKLLDEAKFGKFSTRNVVVNLPESKCFVRVIHVQKMSDSEIDQAIPFEAESYIPIPIDQVYLDWQRLSETGERIEVLLIGSPKDYVDKVVEALEKAGLVPAALEVESQALRRIALPPVDARTVLVVNIQTKTTDMVMVDKGNIQFTSTIPLGAGLVTDAISRGLGVSSQVADKIRFETGIENTTQYPNLKTIIVPVLNNFTAEIKNILAFHAQHSQEKVEQIILAGSGAGIKHFDQFLQEELSGLGLTVTLVDPSWIMHMPDATKFRGFSATAYNTALGLGLRYIV